MRQRIRRQRPNFGGGIAAAKVAHSAKIRDLDEQDCHSTFAFPSRKQDPSGVGDRQIREAAMPAYEICYLDGEGLLTYKFLANCEDDGRAKVLAHAMKLPSAKRLEVWSGEALIYARPSVVAQAHAQDGLLKAG
jgi:hypothetical protein